MRLTIKGGLQSRAANNRVNTVHTNTFSKNRTKSLMQCNTLRLSKCLTVNHDQNLVAVHPTQKKDIFEEADMAVMQRYFKALCFINGNCSALLHHQPSMSASCGIFYLS